MLRIPNSNFRSPGINIYAIRRQLEEARNNGHALLIASNDGGPNHGRPQIVATEIAPEPYVETTLSGKTYQAYKVYSDDFIQANPGFWEERIRNSTHLLVDKNGNSPFHQVLGVVKNPNKFNIKLADLNISTS